MRRIFLLTALALIGCGQVEQGTLAVEYYEGSGQLKVSGYILDGSVRTGLWTFWREDGTKEREGEYKDGLQEGTWTRFNEREEVTGYIDFHLGKEVSRIVVCE
ncbi:MAG: hypothetical protein MK209_10470 [Planctomycetes bacterium]|nr:hypothetical protein [Planctomycetota bacterium]